MPSHPIPPHRHRQTTAAASNNNDNNNNNNNNNSKQFGGIPSERALSFELEMLAVYLSIFGRCAMWAADDGLAMLGIV